MDLSFRLVLRLEHLDRLTGPYRDLTDLVRLGDKEHQEINQGWLSDFFFRCGALCIACDRTGVVGVSCLTFGIRGNMLVGEISTPQIFQGYAFTRCADDEKRQFSVSRILYSMLLGYARRCIEADEINIRDRPGYFKRYGTNKEGKFVRLL